MSAQKSVDVLQPAIVNVHLLPPIRVALYGPIKSKYSYSSSSDYPGGLIQYVRTWLCQTARGHATTPTQNINVADE